MDQMDVLLAEDNPDHQEIIRSHLACDGPRKVSVTIAETGRRFLELSASRRFDCAVIDYSLPDCSADELLKEAAAGLGNCPAVVISCSEAQDAAIKCFRSGTLDFIPKAEAFVGDALLRRVEAAVDESRRRLAERREVDQRLDQLKRLTETDPLTGLWNRRFFERMVARTPAADRRATVACVMADVDRFKQVNDRFGHAAGDEVLRAVAQTIRRLLGRGDTAIRWGGEEFLILKPAPSLAEAWAWAEQLLSAVRGTPVAAAGTMIDVTLSAGLAWDRTVRLGPELVGRADQALYLAKATGRDRLCTAAMVFVDRLLRPAPPDGGSPPDVATVPARWLDFVRRCDPILGPVQREHVLDHCRMVSSTAADLAGDMGLSPGLIEQVREAGLLHDVGKVVVPEELLAKGSALSADERGVVARHVPVGARIAAELGAAEDVVVFVEQHHEPVTSGPTIGARILSAADAWVALTSDRGYRRAMAPEDAIRQLWCEAGGRFDPAVLRHLRPPRTPTVTGRSEPAGGQLPRAERRTA